MTFEVFEVEFETCSEWKTVSRQRIIDKFAKNAVRYVPTIADITKIDYDEDKAILKFERAISLNTVCNILSQLDKKYSYIVIEEIEYKPNKVEVEVK